MAYPKSTAPSAVTPSAYLTLSVDIGSVSANSTLDVDVNAPRNFSVNRPVKVWHTSALNTGITIGGDAQCLVVAGVKKIRFRVTNNTGSAIDPAAQVFHFLQF